jgi:hypothetical protein
MNAKWPENLLFETEKLMHSLCPTDGTNKMIVGGVLVFAFSTLPYLSSTPPTTHPCINREYQSYKSPHRPVHPPRLLIILYFDAPISLGVTQMSAAPSAGPVAATPSIPQSTRSADSFIRGQTAPAFSGPTHLITPLDDEALHLFITCTKPWRKMWRITDDLKSGNITSTTNAPLT